MGGMVGDLIIGSEEEESGENENIDQLSQESMLDGIGNQVVAQKKEQEEIAGALGGSYSFCGGRCCSGSHSRPGTYLTDAVHAGLGIIFASGLGGLLADEHPGIPFVLIGVLDGCIALFALVVAVSNYKQKKVVVPTT